MEDLKKQIQSIVEIYQKGDLSKAEILCKKLIFSKPKIVFLYNLLGLIYVGQKKLDLALEFYEKGIGLDPNYASIYNNLGLFYSHDLPDNAKAKYYFKKSIALNENIPEPHNNLGSLYKTMDLYSDAIKSFKKSILLDKNFFQGYHNLGTTYKTIGNFIEAKKYLKKAIEIAPYNTDSHRTLSGIIKYTKDEKHLSALEEVYKKIEKNDIDKITNISFALGKAYEDIKDFKKSFLHYKEGNDLYKKKIKFSFSETKLKFLNIKKTFHKNLFKKYLKTGNKSDVPIFIVGMPRSGTTLVEQILASHNKVFGCGEQDIISQIVSKRFGSIDLSLFFEKVVNFKSDIFMEIGDEYIRALNIFSKNSEKATDKLPINFFWIGLIKLILPNAKIIHCQRNSKDNCFSIFKNHFPRGKINYSYDFNNIVEYYKLYNDLMDYWNKLFPNFIYNIKYENIILDTENQVNKMLNFCNLDWDKSCLKFYENKRVVKTASDFQVRNKINHNSIDIWKKYNTFLKDNFEKLNN